MAKVTVKANRTTIGVSVLRNVAARNPEVQRQLRDHFAKWQGREVADLVGDHYKEVFVQATRATATGFPGAGRDGKNAIRTGFGVMPLGSWVALTIKYIKEKIRTHKGTEDMWWKRSGVVSTVISRASRSLTRTGGGNLRNAASFTGITSKHAGGNLPQVRLSGKIGLKPTGHPTLDFLARSSFASGTPVWSSFPEGAKTPDQGGELGIVLAVTDRRRPLISQLAAALGQEAVKAISKLKL